MVKRFSTIIFFIFIFILSPFADIRYTRAAGASLFFSPSSNTYNVGDNFTIKVLVNSGGGVGINAAEAGINFDKSLLMANKLNQSESIFELWTTKPSFSNSSGSIIFGGGSTGAYTGSAGVILSIEFTAIKEGTATLSFSYGIVTAHDGKGTNVYSGSQGGTYVLKIKEQKITTPVKEIEKKETSGSSASKGILPPVPEVSSKTHPNESSWYQNNSPELSWKILADLTGISFIMTDIASSSPGNTSDGVIESKIFENLENGEHYFHIKFQNKSGWGPVTHRKIFIDNEQPSILKLEYDNEGDSTNPSPMLKFSAADAVSGIKNYKIIIDGSDRDIEARDYFAEPYKLEKMGPNNHEATVVVYDYAGNTASSSLKFIVDPIKSPLISDIPEILKTSDDLIVRGTSFYPKATIKIFISYSQGEPSQTQVQTDDNGNWNYFHKNNLDKGIYEIWARVVDSRGAESLDSTKYVIKVVSPGVIATYGIYIIIILLIIIAGLVLYIFYQRKKFIENIERINVETKEAKNKLNEIFLALHEEVDELIVYADKRAGLSESEKRIKNKLQEALDISEEFLTKEIEDVEKEIKLPAKKKNGSK